MLNPIKTQNLLFLCNLFYKVCVLGRCNLMFCDSTTCKQRCTLNSRCKMVCGPRTKACHQTCDLGSRCQLSCLGKDCQRNCTGAHCQDLTTTQPLTTSPSMSENTNGNNKTITSPDGLTTTQETRQNNINASAMKTESYFTTAMPEETTPTATPSRTVFVPVISNKINITTHTTPWQTLPTTQPTTTLTTDAVTTKAMDIKNNIISGNHSSGYENGMSTDDTNSAASFNETHVTTVLVENESTLPNKSTSTTTLTTTKTITKSVQQTISTNQPKTSTSETKSKTVSAITNHTISTTAKQVTAIKKLTKMFPTSPATVINIKSASNNNTISNNTNTSTTVPITNNLKTTTTNSGNSSSLTTATTKTTRTITGEKNARSNQTFATHITKTLTEQDDKNRTNASITPTLRTSALTSVLMTNSLNENNHINNTTNNLNLFDNRSSSAVSCIMSYSQIQIWCILGLWVVIFDLTGF